MGLIDDSVYKQKFDRLSLSKFELDSKDTMMVLTNEFYDNETNLSYKKMLDVAAISQSNNMTLALKPSKDCVSKIGTEYLFTESMLAGLVEETVKDNHVNEEKKVFIMYFVVLKNGESLLNFSRKFNK